MLEDKKFGYHSQVSEKFELYKNEIRLQMSDFRPKGFNVTRFTGAAFFAVPSNDNGKQFKIFCSY